jgi:hypothetical protein
MGCKVVSGAMWLPKRLLAVLPLTSLKNLKVAATSQR